MSNEKVGCCVIVNIKGKMGSNFYNNTCSNEVSLTPEQFYTSVNGVLRTSFH